MEKSRLEIEMGRRLQALKIMIPELREIVEKLPFEDDSMLVVNDLEILCDLEDTEPEENDWYGLWSGTCRKMGLAFKKGIDFNIYREDDSLVVNMRFKLLGEGDKKVFAEAGHWSEEDGELILTTVFRKGVVTADVVSQDIPLIVNRCENAWVVVYTLTGKTDIFYYK